MTAGTTTSVNELKRPKFLGFAARARIRADDQNFRMAKKKQDRPLNKQTATVVVRKRKSQIRKLLLLGKGDQEVQEACATEWGISTRQVRRYLLVVRKEWEEQEDDWSLVQTKAQLRQRIDDLYFDARRNNDRQAAANMLRLTAQTFLPQQRQQLDITSKGERIAMTHEEALAEIAAVLRIQERAERENVIDMEEEPQALMPIPISGAKR